MKRSVKKSIIKFFNIFTDVDKPFLFCVVVLSTLGFVMVVSASAGYVNRVDALDLKTIIAKQAVFLGIGVCGLFLCSKIPTGFLQKHSIKFLIFGYLLLSLVLIPWFGKSLNGAQRWLDLGITTVQVSEIARLLFFIYFADYMARRGNTVRTNKKGFLVPMIVVTGASWLLLKQPDFGAAVILTFTCLGMLFLTGVKWRHLFFTAIIVVCVLIVAVYWSDYRMMRFIAFLDPWNQSQTGGYQLVQSLIAYGSGGAFGVGLGASVQKLGYLPEAHNDFILAILGEELGFFAFVIVVGLYTLMMFRTFMIGTKAMECGLAFGASLTYGLGIWLSCQVYVNVFVTLGLLPTKGLILPLMSSGGTAIIVTLMSIGIIMRVQRETVSVSRIEQSKQARRHPRQVSVQKNGLEHADAGQIEHLKNMLSKTRSGGSVK